MTTSEESKAPNADGTPVSSGLVDLSALVALATPGASGPSVPMAWSDLSSPPGPPVESAPTASRGRWVLAAASALAVLALLGIGGAAGHALAVGWTARALASAAASPATPAPIDDAVTVGAASGAPATAPTSDVAEPTEITPPTAEPRAPRATPAVAPAPRASSDDDEASDRAASRTIAPPDHEPESLPAEASATGDDRSEAPAPVDPIAPPAWPDESATSPAEAEGAPSEGPTLEALLERAGYATATATPTPAPAPSGPPEQPTSEDARRANETLAPAVRACAAGAHGEAVVTVVIAGATGRVRSANVTGDFTGTPAGSCMARAARGVLFSPFSRPTFSIAYTFSL